MTRFSQTIAVVTGAGSGIGESTAIRLASEGAKVILVGRTQEKLELVSNKINEASKHTVAHIFTADVTNEDDVNNLATFIEEKYGDLHVVVNNAGGSRQSKILETSSDDWDFVQQTNLKSVFLVSKALGNLMVRGIKTGIEGQERNRSIVNVASLSGYKAGSHIPHYSSAKAAVINFSRALALELAPYGIRVNSVSPGFVETPLTEQGLQNESFQAAIRRNTALKRVGRPEEIANIITFLASHEASYMTGSDVLADGGWLIT
ncbi:SDR family oxidoreductase [Bacillus luteolus]|uniref:SDR family oxidoreductase n=1 Tax=Litchfieldia luteola TaxID=682179 RepID=A0ABR9QKD1_9BACI|nr:SDR family oxidoreductase [Cytobacillus luteolus]MBE4908961.1 SDR family oxidoreductase [Cytobacillus luteolus]MBP1941820.1 3-oxoacyl-[acyl-carrier protein] reductase [Cytobacillus luteolus]